MNSINKFSNHLFWDVNRKELTMEEDCRYIIKQVLEYGLIKDWKIIKEYYGVDRIAQNAVTYRELDKKAVSFVSSLSKVPIEKFRCYTYQQSIPQHWNF